MNYNLSTEDLKMLEAVILNRSGKRAIRLDAQAVDDKNRFYATEMQKV